MDGLSRKWPMVHTTSAFLLLASCLLMHSAGCQRRPTAPPSLADTQSLPAANQSDVTSSAPAWLGTRLASLRDASKPPVVLFDSFHVHNFLHRGLVPGEYSYHRFTGLRRAAQMLEARGCEVRELLVGPLTARQLAGVQLFVVNLASIDRPPWLVSEIAAIEEFVRGGGGILFVTDHSNCYYHQYHLLPLWDRLGLTPTFDTVCERQPECMLSPNGAGWILVRDFAEHPVTRNVRYFATQTGGRVVGDGIVAWTSQQAWADAGVVPLYGEGNMGLLGDMRYSDSEEQGKQGILLAHGVGLGRVTVISDQNSIGDAFISYADNWQLWLNTCKWAGQFQWNNTPASLATPHPNATKQTQKQKQVPDGRARPSATAASTEKVPADVQADVQADVLDDRSDGLPTADASSFAQIVGGQPDRNAPAPAMSADAWAIHCWEPLGSAVDAKRIHWGGTDAEQYYYWWCWMNRWYWATANDRPLRPSEHARGRPMLLAVASDTDDEGLRACARQTLAKRGKVILLPSGDSADDGQPSVEETGHALQRAHQLIASDSTAAPQVTWSAEPVPHWRLNTGGGSVLVISSAARLRNAKFSQPEIAPSAAVLKWENQLRQWLFEQP